MKKMEYVIGFVAGLIGTVVMALLILNGTMPSVISVFQKVIR